MVECDTIARVVTRLDGAPICGTCYRNHRNGLCRPLTVKPRTQSGPLLGGMPDEDRSALLSRVLGDSDIDAGTRLAAALILRRRLHMIGFPTADIRKGALIALAGSVHPVVLAELTGIHIRTAIWWRDAIAASRSRYIGELMNRSSTS